MQAIMEGDEGGTTVRRTQRARKVNPRFVGDDIDENYMKMVGRITASNYSTKQDDKDIKDVNGGDPSSDPLALDVKQNSNDSVLSDCESGRKTPTNKGCGGQNFIAMLSNSKSIPIKSSSDSSSVNIALKTVSLKKIKKMRSASTEGDVNLDPKVNLSAPSASIIVRCRSSTESEESIESESDRKRKLDCLIQNNADYKKLKTRRSSAEILDTTDKSVEVNDSGVASAQSSLSASLPSEDMGTPLDSSNQSNNSLSKHAFSSPVQSTIKSGSSNSESPFKAVLKRAFVSFSSKMEQTQPNKILLSSKSRLLPGKKLKIVSLKPLTNLQEGSSEVKSDSSSTMVLAKGGLVELKIIKKDYFTPSAPNLPLDKGSGDMKPPLKIPVQEVKSADSVKQDKNTSNFFSSDGEDDIPLNKLIEKQEKEKKVKKKKKIIQKNLQSQKHKIKKSKLNKNVSKKKLNDQDDLPLKLLMKKPKSMSKNLTDKVQKSINKSQTYNVGDPSVKKSKSKAAGVVMKKKKIKTVTEESEDQPQPSDKVKVAKMKRFKKMKSKISDSKLFGIKNKGSPMSTSKKLNKGNSKKINKLRFKFPQKKNKAIKKDIPVAKETTNIVISVSGVEGDYACLAIDKDHISTQNEVRKPSPSAKEEPDSLLIKCKSKTDKFTPSKKYTFNSGLVLEEDVSEFPGKKLSKETKKAKNNPNIKEESDPDILKSPSIKDSKGSKKSKDSPMLKREVSVEGQVNKKNKERSLERKDSSNSMKEIKEDIKSETEPQIKRETNCLANPSQTNAQKCKENSDEDFPKVIISTNANNNEMKVVTLDSPRVEKKPRFRNLDKETKGEGELKRSKDRERHRDEKIKKEKHKSRSDKESKKHRDKHHKSDKKDKSNIEARSMEGIKVEEKLFNTEKNDRKESKSLQKPEKESNKIDFSSKKVEKENMQGLPNKIKKKENFEEALLSIPMVKPLSKHKIMDGYKDKKKEKEAKKLSKEKELKQEVVENIKPHHSKETSKSKEVSSSPSKFKSDSHSIKKEEKHKHREERRHSSGSNRSDDRKKDHKDGGKSDLDSSLSHNDKDRKHHRREDKERRHSSHKKHKRDHSESRRKRSHSTSEERKPSRDSISKELKRTKAEVNYKTPNDTDLDGERAKVIKYEDNKDVIINKIIDSEKESSENIKQEKVTAAKERKEANKNKPSAFEPLIPTKIEQKPELVIDEEYLINTNKLHLKEETYNDAISVESTSPGVSVKNEVSQDMQTSLEELSLRSSTSHREVKEELPSSNNEVKRRLTKEESDSVGSSDRETTSEDKLIDSKVDKEEVSIVQEHKSDSRVTSEGDRMYDVNKTDEDISDLGILAELKQFEKIDMEKRQKQEMEQLMYTKPMEENSPQSLSSSEKEIDAVSVTSPNLESSNKLDVFVDSTLDVPTEIDVKMTSEIQNDELEIIEVSSPKIESKIEVLNASHLPETVKVKEQPLSIDESDITVMDCTYSTSVIESKDVSKDYREEKSREEKIENSDKLEGTSIDGASENLSPITDTLKTEKSIADSSDKLKTEKLITDSRDVISFNTIPLLNLAESPPSCNDFKESEDTKKTVTDIIELPVEDISPVPLEMEEISDDSNDTPPTKMEEDLDNEKENLIPDEMHLEKSPPDSPLEEPAKEVVVEKELTPEEKEELERKNKKIVEERLKSFEQLEENLYLIEKVKNKRSKEAKRMVCDCTLTKEELSNNEMGCGDDCLNKLLMIECGSRCPLKDHCMNKKFQQKDYADVEVFNAEMKGCGVRAKDDISLGTFILEYMGEVFDTKEFKRRRKEYAKSSSAHFYFMALRSDRLIDATRKGNISRFINHSCSPNAETQKWTVNGDIRIGFFATRPIPTGEEINFDYRLERYGREPQKCYCGTPECRGWLGEPPDQKTKEEKEEDKRRALKDRQRREGRRAFFEDMDLGDEIEKLTSRGLRNRQDTLNLSRLMVRCEDSVSRLSLLKILEEGEQASQRLFLDYHGLKLLWSWMVDISASHKCEQLKLEILKTLNGLPITNKTQITDSKIINIVERWSKTESKVEKEIAKVEEVLKEASADKKLSDGSEDSDTEASADKSPSDTVSPDDSSLESNADVVLASSASAESAAVVVVARKDEESELSEENTTTTVVSSTSSSSSTSSTVTPIAAPTTTTTTTTPTSDAVIVDEEDSSPGEMSISDLASSLLSVWSELKEAFRIPKTERIEMMKEHEREVDKEYAMYLDRKMGTIGNRTQAFYDRWRYSSVDKEKERQERERRREKWRTRRKEEEEDKGLSKEERRERFAKQVAKEDEEARQRKLQEEMWTLHLERCTLLGHDPYFTPIFDPTGQYYWDPGANGWQAYIGPSGNLPVPASYGMTQPDSLESVCPSMPLNQMYMPESFYSLPHTPVSDEEGQQQPTQLVEMQDAEAPLSLDLASIPLPGELPLPKASPQTTPVLSIPLPGEDDSMDIEPLNGLDSCGSPMPPLAPPGPVTIQLPPKWKMARDMDRRIYFYHTKTRHSQWELPTEDLHAMLLSRYALNSDSESDLESDSDSTSSSDSEDFSSDEDENEEEETEDPLVQTSEGVDEKMIRRPKGKKLRSEKLVQERVISPILFEDREAARRERKEAKERAREEARKERWQVLKAHKAAKKVDELAESSAASSENTLAEDNVASPNDNEEDEHLEEQLIKFSRKQKSEGKGHVKGKSKERAATAMADSSELARKIKDNFRSRMATYIVSVLNPYRKPDRRGGRITSNEDFKFLARKLTHFVMVKELKQLPSIDGLDCSESVKHKTKEFVRKYMSKYGDMFKRDPNDTKEY